ncbi:MAG: hypothetical protein A4E32_01641 [Methanomassiliicoccales archaeon PtaU1.Bin124]|nr:MAG: hypothetical protein A4E32_01641 [Methanomassiliicoccales archaeon PtaU1.Bin124]
MRQWGIELDYAMMAKELKDILGLKNEPVAVTLIKKGMEMPEGYSVPDKPLRHCQAMMRAKHGEMLLVPGDSQACPASGSALGIIPLPEKVGSGEFHHNMGMYESKGAAKLTIDTRPALEQGSVIATAMAPLGKATLKPDVVVITALPEQVFWILPAAQTFAKGGRMEISMASVQASCVDTTIIPYQTGQVNISLGCFGCRKTTDIAPEEMLVGIPEVRLADTVSALVRMKEGPIAKSRVKAV